MPLSYQKLKFKKYLGKVIELTGTVEKIKGLKNKELHSVLIYDIKYKSKLLADHIWIHKHRNTKPISTGDSIMFKATVITYKDKDHINKYGVNRIQQIQRRNHI